MLLALALLLTSVAVDPDVACPSVAALDSAVQRLAPTRTAASAERAVRVSGDERDLVLTLRDRKGAMLAQKRLPRAESDCAALTEAAAIVVATWQRPGDDWLPEIPRLASPPATAPPPSDVELRRAAMPPSRLRYDVAAAALLSIANDRALAAGGEASLAIGPFASRWSGRLALFGEDLRTLSLGFGTATWTRAALALGPSLRLGQVWRLDLHAAALLALVVLRGDKTSGATAFNADPGLRAGLRISRAWGHIAPFVEASLLGWLRAEQVQSASTGAHTALPRLELLLAAGLDIGK